MINAALEKLVRDRAANHCEYCRMPQRFSRWEFALDHIIAQQHRGTDAPDNLALCCGFCNRHKGPNIAGIDPLTGRLSRLFNPRRDKWSKHFRFEGIIITGLTAPGRTTIEVLAMNDDVQLARRGALIEEGIFHLPPATQ